MKRLQHHLRSYMHEQWSKWMNYVFRQCTKNPDGSLTIPAWAVERWNRQMEGSYKDLPKDERAPWDDSASGVISVVSYWMGNNE